MARGRMISRSLSTSEKFASLIGKTKLAEFCHALFPLIVAHADDFGRLQGDPFTVKAQCYPASSRGLTEFAEALDQLQTAGLVAWYVVKGKRYLQVTQFEQHQQGLHKRTTSQFPPVSEDSGNFPEIPGNSGLREEKRTEEKGTKERTSSRASAPAPDGVLTAHELIAIWNGTVTRPIPAVKDPTRDRLAKFQARLKTFPNADDWRLVIGWLNQQPWCRAPGSGQHANWTATLDWLCGSDGVFQRQLEKARQQAPAATTSGDCRHEPKCASVPLCRKLMQVDEAEADGRLEKEQADGLRKRYRESAA